MSRYTASEQKQMNSASKINAQVQLTMISARNKLKEVEDRIYEAKQRINILSKRKSKIEYKSLNKTRMQGFKGSIRDFAETHKQAKIQYQMKRSQQVQNYHDQNLQRRAENKQKINEMKELLQTQNQWVYQNIRRQKQINENIIRKQRSKQHEVKRKKRQSMYQDEQKRLAYFRQFLKNKHLTAKYSKDQEASLLHEKIMQRQKLLQKLERQSSNMSINPESSSMSDSGGTQQKTSTRGFRISSRKTKAVNAQ